MERWYLGGIMMLLLVLMACEESKETYEKPVLKIYLFAPNNPFVTRADEGYVDASTSENSINTLDAWVFESGKSVLVGYAHVNDLIFDAGTGQKEITMEISKEFAELSTKPRVDIYVLANVTDDNCGVHYDENTMPSELMAALLEKKTDGDFFGITNPIMSVPTGGLPMSGFQKSQEVTGDAPVFSANKNNVRLVRAVSKVRFIFSKTIPESHPPVISNLTVTLNDGMVPQKENLFLSELYDYPSTKNQSNIPSGTTYDGGTLFTISGEVTTINDCVNPASYAFDGTTETGQSYEDKINLGLTTQAGQNDPDLSELGRFYLRESDKQLKGKISYDLKISETSIQHKDVDFTMASAGDFTRNHTWIVYGYFLGSGDLVLKVVDVKDWDPNNDTGQVYNW